MELGNIAANRPAAGQRLRDKQKYSSRYWVTASQTSMFAQQQLETATEERCFLSRFCKQDSRNSELVLKQSQAGKNVSTEAEGIVWIRYKATTGEAIANWEDFMCVV
jgi:hypothetical protein